MKRFLRMLAAVLFCGSVIMLTSCSSDDDDNTGSVDPYLLQWQGKKAKYTVMLYGCGGGDVDEQLTDAIPYVQARLNVPANQVRFVVMYSMSKSDEKYRKEKKTTEPIHASYGEWGETYRYEMTPYITKENYRDKCFYKKASEVKLYLVETIKEYINWARQTAPAEHYILMPVNHGGGFDLDNEDINTRAICYDDNQLDEYGEAPAIPTKAFAQALKETDTHLKAIYWNGCMMAQLEVMTEMAPYCDYQFCGAHVQYALGRHAYAIVEALNTYPDNFEQAAICQGGILDGPSKGDDVSFSDVLANDDNEDNRIYNTNGDYGCWRSSGLADINAEVKKLAKVVADGYDVDGIRAQIEQATRSVYMFDDSFKFVDVLDYSYHIYRLLQSSETEWIYNDLWNAVERAKVYQICRLNRKIVDAEGETVYYKWPATNRYSLGISIYTKSDKVWENCHEIYKASAFDKVTGWSRFLDKNVQKVDPKVNPANTSKIVPFWI